MRLSWRTYLVLMPVALAAAIAQSNSAPASSDDLPAAPSASIPRKAPKPKPAPPQPAASDQQAPLRSDESAKASTPPKAADEGVIEQSGTTIYSTVNEVSVVFTVTDKHNHYVKDLTQNDFKVLDNEKPVEDIRSFRRETDLPLQVGLLIDASNSIRDRFKFEQESAIEFLNSIVRPRYDEAFVVGFDVEPELTQDFTDNTEKLANGVRMLRPGGGTAMFDALYFACRDKLLKSQQTSSVRRAIILVSDGDDNESHVTREEAIEMALRANVIVYTISTNFPSGGPGDKILQRIAEATGGRAFQPFQLTDVANAFTEIQNDLRSQYELSYRPADFVHDGRYRTIAITAVHKGLKVRSRTGYYAPGE